MSKRKILMLALSVCMVAILAVGGTLAYFTDTDEATNVFTVGHVDITLEEDFGDNDPETNEKLFPGKQNAVKKEVKITLGEDSEDSYVWYTYKIPAVLDSTDGSTGTNNIVHVNAYGYTWDTYRNESKYWPAGVTAALPLEQTWDHTRFSPEGLIGTETIDGIEYNVYLSLYHGKLTAGDETSVGMCQVYMDAGVNTNKDGQYVDKNGKVIDYNFADGIDIIVTAYGIQADGFADVYAAYDAYQAQN